MKFSLRSVILPLLLLLISLHHTSSCLPAGAKNSVTIGDMTYVCLVVSPIAWGVGSKGNQGKFLRIVGNLKADDLSEMTVSSSWTSSFYKDDSLATKLGVKKLPGYGVGISIASMGVPSYQKGYRTVQGTLDTTNINSSTITSSRTFPLLTAIINVDGGKVTSVTWDDTCSWCSDSQCDYNTYDYSGSVLKTIGNKACWVDDGSCHRVTSQGQDTSTALCSLRVFVMWTGTDSTGSYFKSAANRLSRLTVTQATNLTSTWQQQTSPILAARVT